MGNVVSKKLQITKVTRRVGDLLNTTGLPPVHTEVLTSHIAPITRIPVCRCWKSGNTYTAPNCLAKFPLCDNSHQKLERLGVECGPAMLEIRKRL